MPEALLTELPSHPFSYSNQASSNQARGILHLLIRFKHQARISLHITVASFRFLRFYHHRDFCLQVCGTPTGGEAQVYGSHRDSRAGLYDLLCDDF